MLRWIGRIFFGLLSVIVIFVLILAGLVIYDAQFGTTAADNTNMTFTDAEGNTLLGYVAQPDTPGPHPAVLLIHEWWGLNHGITVLADALAAEGYVVLAPDAYRGNLTSSIPRAIWLVMTTPEEQIFADLDTALAHMRDFENVDPEQVATMGFCFGGGHSLQLGLRQSQNTLLTIMYYGAVVTDPDLLRPLTEGRGVLGIFAEEDQQIFPEDVLEFEAALNSLEIPNQVTIYEGVGHGFLDEENFQGDGPAGEAWRQTLAFLAERF
ncbi:MAG: dienelactone hydrolase family protein [Chloroflexota bacterium]